MKNILIDVEAPPGVLERLRGIPNVHVQVCDPVSEDERPLPPELLRGQNVLLCFFPPTNFNDFDQLEWVQLCSAGFEQLRKWNLPERRIRATNASGVFDVPIAEWCFAMMVNLARDLRGMIRNQDNAIWDRSARFQNEIRGKTVGFWGYGGLARESARMAKAAGMTVYALAKDGPRTRENFYLVPGTGDPEGALPDKWFTYESRFEFLKSLDFLILALPLNDRTRGIVGEPELRALAKTAYLLNPARGPLIQEQALIKALQENWFAGAAIDTHYYYPMPPDHPLWRIPNVILTPHISGSSLSPAFLPRIWDIFLQNVGRFLHHEPLWNEIRPEKLRPA